MRDVFSVVVFYFTDNEIDPFEKPILKKNINKKVQKHSAFGLLLSPVSSCLETLIKHPHIYELLHNNRERTNKSQMPL